MTASPCPSGCSSVPPHLQPVQWAGSLLVGLLAFAPGEVPPVRAQADSPDQTTLTIDIRNRQFQPDRLVLPQGRRTVLQLKNHDSELHAFMPSELFAGESLNVSGNGAPEFGSQGLTRVIIPSDGLVEIRFIPARAGEYRYRCDMPGHQMSGVIVVE